MSKGISEKKKSFREWIRCAFAVGDEGEPDGDDLAALDRLAGFIASRRLETPAILFLQSCIPLSYIGSQVMVGLEPIVGPLFPRKDWERLARIFERRDGIDRLTVKIDRLVSEREKNGK
ncbi:hypothetical protein JW926_16770 [Candidatus Sumerlaeota bacterium]|nr:hypothetical protein [Candidatus Sumerlaeota bacterium]